MKNKICVITSHGFAGYPEEMDPLGKYLESKGYDWYNLTIPGHDTTPEDLREKKWTDWTSCVSNNIVSKMKEYPDGVIMAGLSMGGLLTLWALENHPGLKAGVSLSAPMKILNWYQNILLKLPIGKWVKRSEDDIKGILDEEGREEHRAYDSMHTDSVKELQKLVNDVKGNLGKITQPLLVVHSTKDELVDVKNADFIIENVSSEIKNRMIVENSGHVLTRDFDKELIFNEIHEFISSLI